MTPEDRQGPEPVNSDEQQEQPGPEEARSAEEAGAEETGPTASPREGAEGAAEASEAAGQAQAAATAEGEAQEEKPGPASDTASPPRPPTTQELVEMALGLFLEHAWICLGLRVLPGMEDTAEDLEGARIAIDCAGFLSEKFAPTATEEQRRRVELELTNLRLNYARKVE